VILGGIRNYETMKTMRCGALTISPILEGPGSVKGFLSFIKKRPANRANK
jgi:hypothetical protein